MSGVDVGAVIGWEAIKPCDVCCACASVADPMHNDNARALGRIFGMLTSRVRQWRPYQPAA